MNEKILLPFSFTAKKNFFIFLSYFDHSGTVQAPAPSKKSGTLNITAFLSRY